MADVEVLSAATPARTLNVADRLAKFAAAMPEAIAVACAEQQPRLKTHRTQRGKSGAAYATTTFAELDADATRIARGLAAWGVPPGTRLALLVRPGIEFVTLVFALLRAGMVIVLVDPGLGRRNLIRCLAEAEPEGFVAIGVAQAARRLLRHKFPRARWNVTVGRRWLWGGVSLDDVRAKGGAANAGWAPPTNVGSKEMPGDADTTPATPAAIIFTSGSTGPPKGVLYTHQMFDTQVEAIQSAFGIEPGGIDLACFPLFALFNAAMGVTTVLPEMDFSRPATADPKKLLAAANDWQATQSFASPAVWRVVSEHCGRTGERIDSLRRVFSCGAPVPARVIRATLACVDAGAKMHTPYGATECLPVSTIEAAEVLGETAARTDHGAGVCVGREFDSIDWRVIAISDEPIASIDACGELPAGEIGELIVRGPQASPSYATRKEFNVQTKIGDWHRTGDVGYFDEKGRFWYCGRKSQRVETKNSVLFTEQAEAIFNSHPFVRGSALVGIGPRGSQIPVIVYTTKRLRSIGLRNDAPHVPLEAYRRIARDLLEMAKANEITKEICTFLPRRLLPVDIRHNAKINRELLAAWADKRTRSLADRSRES